MGKHTTLGTIEFKLKQIKDCLIDFELIVLCDKLADGSTVQFIRRVDKDNSTTDFDITMTQEYIVQGTVGSCDFPEYETEQKILCDDTTGDGTAIVKFFRHTIYDITNGRISSQFDTDLDGLEYVPVGELEGCAEVTGETVSTEVGCLSDSATVDMSQADRCAATRVIISGVTLFISLTENWTSQELVDAVNAERPGTLTLVDGEVVRLDGESIASIEIICDATTFTEDFGEGGSEGARLTSPNTNYTFKNTGPIGDGFYGVTTFSDSGLTGPTSYNTANDTITADALGNTNGNAFVVNADFDPGEFYRQPIVGLTGGLEYSVQFYTISTNDAARDDINPNISVSVVDTTSGLEIASFETGDILRNEDGEWSRFAFDFESTSSDLEFVLVNNAPGGRGNDLAIDQITFAAVNRESIRGIDVTSGTPIEIVKILDSLGNIKALRVFSADGEIEYEIPSPDGKVLTTGVCGANTSNLVTWVETLCDDQGTRFQRFFTSLNDVVTHVDMDFEGEEYEVVGNVISCLPEEEKCMKSKQNAEFTSDFLAIEGAVVGSSDPVTAKIDGPMDGIFATISMQNGTTWGSGSSGGQVVTGVRVTPGLGSATIDFDFPDACEGVIDVERTRLMFWDLDGQGGSVNQEFVEFETPFARVSDNLLIMNAPTNTIVGGVPGANAEHNWVEWDGLVDSIHLKRDPEIGLLPRGNILLEGIEIGATVIAIYTGKKQADGSWKYFDYQDNELTDPILVARLRPCNETICSGADTCEDTFFDKELCDSSIESIQLFHIDSGTEEVFRREALSNTVQEVAPGVPGVDWHQASAYDSSGDFYYLVDQGSNTWYRYQGQDLATAPDNLGVFTGDTFPSLSTGGAFDPSKLDRTAYYVSNPGKGLYEVNFTTGNITLLGTITGTVGSPSSLSIDSSGNVFLTTISAGQTLFNSIDIDTLEGTETGAVSVNINGSDYDHFANSGFYGISVADQLLYRWTALDGSDLVEIGPAPSSGTLSTGRVGLGEAKTFIRRYTTDCKTGEVSTSDINLRGESYTASGAIQRCCCDAGSSGDSTSDEVITLCDDNGSFLRRITKDSTGLVTVTDTTLNGITAYTPVGTATVCTADAVEQELPESDEVVTLCDDNGSFLRRITNDGEGVITITDTALDGTTAYTTSGTVTNCSVSSSDVEQEILCAEGERFVRHTEYQNGVVVNTFDTAIDMTTPVSFDEGNVERCQPRDVEIVVMCEPDGTRFLRHITRDPYDNQVSVRDTDVDGVTSYIATGNETPCGCQEANWVKDLCDVIVTPVTIPALFANGESLSNRQVTFTGGDYTISARAQESVNLTALGVFVGILGDRISLSGIPAKATNIQMGVERWNVSEGEAMVAFSESVTVVSGGYTSSGTTITATADGINAGVIGLPDGTTDFSFEVFRTNETGSGAITFISFDIPLPTKFQRRFNITCDGTLTTSDFTCDGANYTVEGDVVCCEAEGNSCENPLFTKSSESWTEKLCDVETEILSLDVYTIDQGTETVYKYDAISNTVLDSFTAGGGVNYPPSSAYNATTDTLYVFDQTASAWHSYSGSDIGAGFTNLGTFAGPSVAGANAGAIDPTTGLGHFYTGASGFIVDYQSGTVTASPALSPGISGLAIDTNGVAHVASGSDVGTADLATGVVTITGSIAPHIGHGVGVDNTGNELGIFGSDAVAGQLVRWTEPDGSDVSVVGTYPAGATVDIGQAELNITTTEFIRHYEKECSGNVVYTDYDNEGQLYTSSGDVQVCTVTEDTISAENIEGTLINVSTAGNQASPAGSQQVSFANTGSSDALVAGGILPAGATVTYTGYFDYTANTYMRLAPIAYNAQTSSLLVSITP